MCIRDRVRSVSSNGTLSMGNSSITTAINSLDKKNSKLIKTYYNGIINFTEDVDYKIYNLSGGLVEFGSKVRKANLQHKKDGIYIVHAINAKGKLETRKILK
jgi:hypothetical protein